MSTPGHHHEVVLIGDVHEVYADAGGAVFGVILLVDAGEPCQIPVMFPAARADVSIGVRVWVRGQVAYDDSESWRRPPVCAGTMDRPREADQGG